jgi:hypothetical protein
MLLLAPCWRHTALPASCVLAVKQTHLGSLAAGVASDDSPSESWDSEPEADLTCVAMRGGTSSSKLRPPPGIGTCGAIKAISGVPDTCFA